MSAPRQSVELLLAPRDERAVRAAWQGLAQVGLASLHHHRSASNRPHLTLVTSRAVTPEDEERLVAAVGGRLPIRTAWGDVTTFGHGPYAVVRLVRPTPDLLALQCDLAAVLGVPQDDLTAPGRWTPHVSFALRVPAEQRDTVVARLRDPDPDADAVRPPMLTWVSARRWDPVARRAWTL